MTAPTAISRSSTWAPEMLSVVRIISGVLFLSHGAQKLFGALAGPEGRHPVALVSLMGLAGVIELGGGTLIAVGLFTRAAAFLAAGEMAVAYFMVHLPNGPWPILNHGELPILFCLIWLYLVAAGPGPWSLDAMLSRRRTV